TRRFCRSKAPGPRAMRSSPGQVTGPVIMIVILAMLAGVFGLSRFVIQSGKSAVAERRQKDARMMANSVITDYMRQFSQDPYEGHYDDLNLRRPQTPYVG